MMKMLKKENAKMKERINELVAKFEQHKTMFGQVNREGKKRFDTLEKDLRQHRIDIGNLEESSSKQRAKTKKIAEDF